MSWLRSTVLGLLLALAGAPALAQYRPPPMGDAERHIADGDELREAAAKAASFGEKDTATERLKEAIAAYEKALAVDPNAVAAAAGLGAACTTLKDWPKIITVLTPVREKFPADTDLNFSLGIALLKTKRYADAEKLLGEVGKAKRPDLFLTHYYLGWLALQAGDGARAVTEFDTYLAERPAAVADNDYEILVFKGRGYLLQRNAPRARAAFEEGLRARPETVGGHLGLVGVLELEGKTGEALKMLEALVQRFPNAPEPKERLGRLYLSAGDLKRAEATATALLKLPESAAAHLLMGDVRLALKQYGAAENELRAAVRLAPGQAPVLMSLARALQVQGRHGDAIAVLDQATTAIPNNVELIGALGTVCRRASRYPRAVAAHQEVIRLAPKSALGYVLLGADQFAMGAWDAAVDAYSTALELEPNHQGARHWLAQTLGRRAKVRADKGQLPDATRDLRRAVELERSVLALRSLGAVSLTQAQYAEARTALAAAVSLPGASWEDQYLLGYAALGTGDDAAALTAFERAAELAPDAEAKAQVNVGWALAKLSTGDLDAAVARLADNTKLSAGNLSLALLRRALENLHEGDVAAAQKDFELGAPVPHGPEVDRLEDLVRGLLAVEQGRFEPAQNSFRRAVPAADRSADATATRTLLAAYVEYRRGRTPEARKRIDAMKKGEAWAEFARANSRRDGELSYFQGAMPRAEKMFREALVGDPQNPWVAHNLACVQYRKGAGGTAVATWKALAGTVAESSLNVGIYYHATKDMKQAAAWYGRYLGTRGGRSALAREWKDRIEAIYGVSSGDGDEEKQPGEAKP